MTMKPASFVNFCARHVTQHSDFSVTIQIDYGKLRSTSRIIDECQLAFALHLKRSVRENCILDRSEPGSRTPIARYC